MIDGSTVAHFRIELSGSQSEDAEKKPDCPNISTERHPLSRSADPLRGSLRGDGDDDAVAGRPHSKELKAQSWPSTCASRAGIPVFPAAWNRERSCVGDLARGQTGSAASS